MISLYLQKKGMVYRDEVAEDVSRLDGIALIDLTHNKNQVKYFSYCVWWNGYEEFTLQEFKVEMEDNKHEIEYAKDCI